MKTKRYLNIELSKYGLYVFVSNKKNKESKQLTLDELGEECLIVEPVTELRDLVIFEGNNNNFYIDFDEFKKEMESE